MMATDFLVARGGQVTPAEVISLRSTVGWGGGTVELWQACITQSLCILTARNKVDGELVGLGFVAGNPRHAQLVDLTVDPRFQRNGIARQLVNEAVVFAQESKILFLGLTWNESAPWLRDFYYSTGFRDISNAMWHHDSLARLR